MRIIYFTEKGEAIIWNIDRCKEERKFKFIGNSDCFEMRDKIYASVNFGIYIGYYVWYNFSAPPLCELLHININNDENCFDIIKLPPDVEPDDLPLFKVAEENILKVKTREYCGAINLKTNKSKFASTTMEDKQNQEEIDRREEENYLLRYYGNHDERKTRKKRQKIELNRFVVKLSNEFSPTPCQEYCLFRNYKTFTSRVDVLSLNKDSKSKSKFITTTKYFNDNLGDIGGNNSSSSSNNNSGNNSNNSVNNSVNNSGNNSSNNDERILIDAVEISPRRILLMLKSSFALLDLYSKEKPKIISDFKVDTQSILKMFLLPSTNKDYEVARQVVYEYTMLPMCLVSIIVQFLP